MTRVVVSGAAGRMGKRIVTLIRKDPDFRLAGAVEAAGSEAVGRDAGVIAGCGRCDVRISESLEEVLPRGDVLIDFSHAEATLSYLKICQDLKKPAVVGTTGHTPSQRQGIERMAKSVPLVLAPNMSVGVNVMWKIIGEAARFLGSEFDVSVKEVHHIHKKDKPSGTALQILKVLSSVPGIDAPSIPVESIREGEVVGDHTTVFEGPEEVLEIAHRAGSRDTFARGALRAAQWVAGKKHGLYTMADVLGL